MGTKDKIKLFAKKTASFRTSNLVKELKLSRQSVASHLKSLVDEGTLLRIGSTRGATYQLAKGARPKPKQALSLIKKLSGLKEDKVWSEVDRKMNLKEVLNQNAYSIFAYAFTEMLNNAIDHSHSSTSKISVCMEKGSIQFEIRDFGVGIFANVMKKFALATEFDGLEHVLKGKQTSAPEAHSGEGIFFTSRVADLYVLRSHKLTAKIDNRIPDTFVAEDKSIKGTSVVFSVSQNTKKKLKILFAKYTGPNFKFDRADQRVKVSVFGGFLSRSEAKRLLNGLDKFDELTFDFRGVKEIGQGFADEIFRVYAKAHPDKKLGFDNANKAVAFMIRRAKG